MAESSTPHIEASLRRRLLIVDDDRHFCEMLQAWLGKNYELDFAHDGEHGVRKARQERPDLILLDVMMPKLSGFSLAWVFKHDPFFRGVPVVYCTAHASEWMDPEEALSKADGFLLKPFSLAQLRSTLEKFLANWSLTCSDLREVQDDPQWGPRFPVDMPCGFQADEADGGTLTDARLATLTLWGGLVSLPKGKQGLPTGTLMRMTFSDGDSTLNLVAKVLCASEDGGIASMGVRFHFSNVTQERAYQKLLARHGGPAPSANG